MTRIHRVGVTVLAGAALVAGLAGCGVRGAGSGSPAVSPPARSAAVPPAPPGQAPAADQPVDPADVAAVEQAVNAADGTLSQGDRQLAGD